MTAKKIFPAIDGDRAFSINTPLIKINSLETEEKKQKRVANIISILTYTDKKSKIYQNQLDTLFGNSLMIQIVVIEAKSSNKTND